MPSGSGESAILIAVPEADPVIGRWRERHDAASARGVPAHLTLLYPWRPPPLTDDDLAALAAALAGVAPFTLTFGDFGRFPTVLFLKPDDDAPARALIRRLAAAFPEHPPYGGSIPVEQIAAHVTIADLGVAGGDLSALAAEIEPDVRPALPIVHRVDAVTVMETGADGARFSVRATLRLG